MGDLSEELRARVDLTSDVPAPGRLGQIARRLESRLLQRLPAAVVLVDDQGVVVYWNDEAGRMYGRPAADALGRPVVELDIGPSGTPEAAAIVRTVFRTGRWEGDYEARRVDGSVVPVHATLERIDDDEIDFHGVVGASVDISERRQLEQHLAFQALHDELTGLPNRRIFVEHLENALSRSAGTGRRTAVMFIDLDDFRSINERMGHEVGDEVLRAAGALISAVLRAGDIVARFGGDEFVVCYNDLEDAAEAYAASERILKVLSAPFRVDGVELVVSATVGVALSQGDSRAEGLVRNADSAMCAAKLEGKGRVELFDHAVQEESRRWHGRVVELKRAITGGEIEAHFQPEIALDTGEIVGFEALARWAHPAEGMVQPDDFIATAEESGLISAITEVVMAAACQLVTACLELAPERFLTVAVNVSPRQLSDPDLPGLVRSAIEAADIPAGRICLEVTESALANANADAAAAALRQLKGIGVQIAIDDFGTGYSSLSRLHRFPLDYLKIDRSFIAGMTHRPEDGVIASAVLGLAHTLGLQTIAEGIEDEEQVRRLVAMGCKIGQGYLWSRPLPLPEAIALITGGQSPAPSNEAETTPWPVAGAEEVADATDDVTTVLAQMAHEMAGPLTVITGHAELITSVDDAELHALSGAAILRAARRATAALDHVRDVAALDAGTLRISQAPVGIREVVDDAQASLELPDGLVAVDLPDATVDGDADRLVSVFANLFSNALKHTPAGTAVRVHGTVGPETLSVHVVDDGPGVPAELSGLIFRKFGRAHRRTKGTGLGLYLARGIVRAHGGELSHRPAPGGGSDFVVELPLSRHDR
ncbi:MAG TPA: EAL domain-containing protein [Acidimicrobiales bacterium]|nr:EAL domain-containing protein [Acidimicrobiales bacterium]